MKNTILIAFVACLLGGFVGAMAYSGLLSEATAAPPPPGDKNESDRDAHVVGTNRMREIFPSLRWRKIGRS